MRNWARIGKPVDRTEWGMTPPTVNAYYSPTMNEIVFPAGILQPPFHDPNADDAVNYGGMGAVIGHEMTHGFDDQERQFDAQGRLRDWLTAQVWRQQAPPEQQRLLVNVDPHAPARWRVNGPLSNMPEFAKAFSCQPGDPVARNADVQARIW